MEQHDPATSFLVQGKQFSLNYLFEEDEENDSPKQPGTDDTSNTPGRWDARHADRQNVHQKETWSSNWEDWDPEEAWKTHNGWNSARWTGYQDEWKNKPWNHTAHREDRWGVSWNESQWEKDDDWRKSGDWRYAWQTNEDYAQSYMKGTATEETRRQTTRSSSEALVGADEGAAPGHKRTGRGEQRE